MKDLLPRNPNRTFAIQRIEAMIEFLTLSIGECNVVVTKAIPETLDQIEALFGRKLINIDGGLRHGFSFPEFQDLGQSGLLH